MFHLAAFDLSYNSAAETDITPVSDDILTIQNSHFITQRDAYALFACAMGATHSRSRLVTPSLRQITTPFIRPIEVNATPGSRTAVADWRSNPILLKALEEIQVLSVQGSGGAEREIVLLGLSNSPILTAPQGTVYCMRGTSTTASVANAWTSLTVTWQDILPTGLYTVVGLEVIGVTEVAARLIFEEQTWRPGCPGGALVANLPNRMFVEGTLGEWGRFTSNRMPTVQVLNTAAISAHEAYLYFVRVG